MPSFSQRNGLKPINRPIQVDSMDKPLRNGLWNSLCQYFLDRYENVPPGRHNPRNAALEGFANRMWVDCFKNTRDEWRGWVAFRDYLKESFYQCTWHEAYDLVEFIVSGLAKWLPDACVRLVTECNRVMEQERSGYRFAGHTLTPVTDNTELGAVVEATQTPIEAVNQHMVRAAELLGDRRKPDYRNSIKESISGVEAICRVIAHNDKATLGDTLKAIERCGQVGIHPAMRNAFSSLYGYTNDQQGIRHSLLDGDDVNADDARFMLVACSAFINLLVAKASLRR
jgi:hypothetical protein